MDWMNASVLWARDALALSIYRILVVSVCVCVCVYFRVRVFFLLFSQCFSRSYTYFFGSWETCMEWHHRLEIEIEARLSVRVVALHDAKTFGAHILNTFATKMYFYWHIVFRSPFLCALIVWVSGVVVAFWLLQSDDKPQTSAHAKVTPRKQRQRERNVSTVCHPKVRQIECVWNEIVLVAFFGFNARLLKWPRRVWLWKCNGENSFGFKNQLAGICLSVKSIYISSFMREHSTLTIRFINSNMWECSNNCATWWFCFFYSILCDRNIDCHDLLLLRMFIELKWCCFGREEEEKKCSKKNCYAVICSQSKSWKKTTIFSRSDSKRRENPSKWHNFCTDNGLKWQWLGLDNGSTRLERDRHTKVTNQKNCCLQLNSATRSLLCSVCVVGATTGQIVTKTRHCASVYERAQ